MSKPGQLYDAFLSYVAADQGPASGIRKGLHRIGRRLGQRRALRVCDRPQDPGALAWSRFLVVTLSPAAAHAPEVNQDVAYWLTNRGRDQLLIVLAGGRLRWDREGRRFDPEHSDAAPPALLVPGALPVEPLFIDVGADAPWDYRAPGFRERLTSLAAPIHGKPKDQLSSDDLREQRTFRRLRAAAVAGLVLLSVGAVVAGGFAVGQSREALHQRDEAIARRLVAEARDMLDGTNSGGDIRAFQQVLAARALSPTPDDAALLQALNSRPNTLKIIDIGDYSRTIALSPDGHRFATFSGPTVRIWSIETGLPVGGAMTGPSTVASVAFSPDGQRLATGSEDGAVRVWDPNSATMIGQPLLGHTDVVTDVAYSPDGGRLAASGRDAEVRLWDTATGQPFGAPLVGHTGTIQDLAFAPDGRRLATAGDDNTVRLWDADTGQQLGVPLIGHTAPVGSVAFSPDGRRLASAGADAKVRVWNPDTSESIELPAVFINPVFGVAFSPDGARLATASDTVQLWDAFTGQELGQPMHGHTGVAQSVAFTGDGTRLVSTGRDATVRIWNASEPVAVPSDAKTGVSLSPDGRLLATSARDFSVRLWDTATGRAIGAPLIGHTGHTPEVAFRLDGQRVATASHDGTARLWDTATGQQLGPPLVGHTGPVTAVAFSPDGHRLATGGEDATVRLWDADTGRPFLRGTIVTGHVQRIGALAFSADGHRIATASEDGTARLWDADTGAPIGEPLTGHTEPLYAIAFSPDGKRLATGGDDATVRLWDTASGKQIGQPMTGHTSEIRTLAFSPDGHLLASGGADWTARVWNADTGAPIGSPLTGFPDFVLGVAFSADGTQLTTATGGDTAMVRHWSTTATPMALCQKLTANMSRHQWQEWISPDIDYVATCPDLPIPDGAA